MVSVSSGITCGSRWGGGLSDCPVWSDMPPAGSTLGGGSGGIYGFTYAVSTLIGGASSLFCGGTVFVGGFACGGATMLKVSASYFKATSSYFNATAFLGRPLWCQRLDHLMSWGCRMLGSGNVEFPDERTNLCTVPMCLCFVACHELVSLLLVGSWGCD